MSKFGIFLDFPNRVIMRWFSVCFDFAELTNWLTFSESLCFQGFLLICNKVAQVVLFVFFALFNIFLKFFVALVAGFRRFSVIFIYFVWKIKDSVLSLY